jgi:TolB-like protein
VTTPNHEEILHQLSRILDSPQFTASSRLSRFLRYVVERTCAGEGRQLKEFRIATDVFDRGARFDSRLDSLVRVEAGRLRSKLVEYYSERGSGDAVIIRIPKGGYTPEFTRRAARATARAWPRRSKLQLAIGIAAVVLIVGLLAATTLLEGFSPGRSTLHVSIAVLPFPASPEVEAVTFKVSRELTRLGTLNVISNKAVVEALHAGMTFAEIGSKLGADVIVQVTTARDGDDVTIEATLVDVGTQQKFWVDDFKGELRLLPARVATAAQRAVARNPGGSYWQ